MVSTPELQHTAVFSSHQELGGKLVDFGGWALPASYKSVIEEHRSVRNAVGIFDVSHMGEVRVKGPDATAFLEWVTINEPGRLEAGQGQYTAMLNAAGGMVDDLIMYRLAADEYFICTNASNDAKDFAWLKSQSGKFAVDLKSESTMWSQFAVQGPKSLEALSCVLGKELASKLAAMPYMTIAPFAYKGADLLIARTGYTGEHGYEVYVPNAAALGLWQNLLRDEAQLGLRPIGLGARDTLRLEACYLLYGNDMDENVSPLEAGIGWAVRKSSTPFLGRERVDAERQGGLKKRITAFVLEEPGVARHGMEVYVGDTKVGVVTSGSMLPTLEQSGGMALIDIAFANPGQSFSIDIRGKRKLAKAMKRPLYIAKVK